jgi:3-hydroxyethyl bacteriochlorophyllide a dehydrogenase
MPDLIVGHGVLGRLLARLADRRRRARAHGVGDRPRPRGRREGYEVIHPDDDPPRLPRDLRCLGRRAALLDTLIGRLAKGGEVVLAGFYAERRSASPFRPPS